MLLMRYRRLSLLLLRVEGLLDRRLRCLLTTIQEPLSLRLVRAYPIQALLIVGLYWTAWYVRLVPIRELDESSTLGRRLFYGDEA